MRKACASLTVLAALSLAAVASAEPFTASIKAFKAAPVPISGSGESAGSCTACGTGLELEYVFEGEGYAATAMNPKGGTPPLAAVNLYLPAGMQVHPAPFAQCTDATLKNIGPSGCPRGSVASPLGHAQTEVTFGSSRAQEEATLQAFVSKEGLLFFE